jgi:hypothetical protein
MAHSMLKLAVVVLSTSLLATNVLAQETKRGTRGGASQGTSAGTTGTRGSQTAATPAATPKPAAQPAPATGPAASSQPVRNWWGGATPGIDRRQAQQDFEIERGRRNGSLTAAEAAQLRAEQARIADLERRAKADGNVTREERAQIRKAQQDAQAHIWQESHDNEREGGRRHRGWGRGWW